MIVAVVVVVVVVVDGVVEVKDSQKEITRVQVDTSGKDDERRKEGEEERGVGKRIATMNHE